MPFALRSWSGLVLLALGCRNDPVAPLVDSEASGSTATTADTGTRPTGGHIDCASDHALRVVCTFDGFDAGLVLQLDGRTWPLEGSGEQIVADLRPQTTYPWAILSGVEELMQGSVTTAELHPGAYVDVVITGAPSMPVVGLETPCGDHGNALVLDLLAPDAGKRLPDVDRVLAYEDISPVVLGVVEGVTFTEDDTILTVSASGGGIAEFDHDGRVVMAIQDEDMTGDPHHDVFRRDGLTYVLQKEYTEDVWLDMVEVFDASGTSVAVWRLADHLDPFVDPYGYVETDYSHGNSIWVDEAGDWYLSSRHLSAVFKIAGLQEPDAGAVRWVLAGDPYETRITGTLELLDGESFARQHNVHLTPEGHLAMFDNRRMFPELSRAVWFDVDEDAGTVRAVQSWPLPYHCPFQGSAWPTEAGGVLATCAPQQAALEFLPDQDEPVAQVEVHCVGGLETYVPRIVPLRGW